MTISSIQGRISLGVLAALLPACGKMPDNTPPGAAFSRAVPSYAQVGIEVPGGEIAVTQSLGAVVMPQVLPGLEPIQALAAMNRAEFYTVTRNVSSSVNGGVLALLEVIKAIAQSPPSEATEAHRSYGPWTTALDPLAYTFVMDVADRADIKFALLARPRGADGNAWKPILAGTYHPVSANHGSGTLGVDADAVQALDPSGDHGQGKVGITWSNADPTRVVEVVFDNFADRRRDETFSAVYRYKEAPDTSGEFQFLVHGDIDGGKDPARSAKENAAISSRWDSTGAGRADVEVTGGDLGDTSLHIRECWNQLFERTYYTDDRGFAPTEGDPSSCVP